MSRFKGIIEKSSDLAQQDQAAETFVLNLGKSTVHRLGDIETEIWNAIDGTRTAEDLVNLICDKYEIDQETAASDIQQFLDDLAENGLIKQKNND